MAGYLVSDTRKVTTQRFIEMKQKKEKISMLTAYDFTTAGIVDSAGVDGILIGDSASNVMAGNATTLPITVEQMIYHAASVVKAVKRALVVCDMPFGSYQADCIDGVKNAIRIMKESGCDALKLEGGVEITDTVKRILDAGIPVMGHLGLTPQSINKFGTYAVRAKEEKEAEKLASDAKALAEAGCFSIVLEKVPARIAKIVTDEISIPLVIASMSLFCAAFVSASSLFSASRLVGMLFSISLTVSRIRSLTLPIASSDKIFCST